MNWRWIREGWACGGFGIEWWVDAGRLRELDINIGPWALYLSKKKYP